MTIKQRGRKSAGDMTVVTAMDARIEAPPHLTPEQRAEWDLIVNSLPSDFFRPGDIPLLGAFCAASALYKEALLLIRNEGMIVTPPDTDYFDEHGDLKSRRYGRQTAHPAKDILTSQAACLASLAVKLRLCPSARFNERVAGTKHGSAPNGSASKRPWDDEDDQATGTNG